MISKFYFSSEEITPAYIRIALQTRKYYEVPNRLVTRFIGREETLSQMDVYFSGTDVTRPKVFILHALGGQGKSQIALEYCRRSRESHQGIFWINASSKTTTTEAFEMIANVLQLGNSNQKIKDVLSTLEQWSTRWILVFDNYDWPGTFGSLKNFFPTGISFYQYYPQPVGYITNLLAQSDTETSSSRAVIRA